jgi:hypothetical protein
MSSLKNATEATSTDEKEHPTEDGAGNDDEQSFLCKFGVCGAVGMSSMLFQCINVDCPLTWMNSECAGIPKGVEVSERKDVPTWLCPMCGEH